MAKILFIPCEDGFGPSALLSYIVKDMLKKRLSWKVTVWNKSRFNYNTKLYSKEISENKLVVKPISSIIELEKTNGRVSVSKTFSNLLHYHKQRENYPEDNSSEYFDMVVDFGTPMAARWASKKNMKTISVFDHCWSKTLEMILGEYKESKFKGKDNSTLKKWNQLIESIKEEEKNTQRLFLFKYITPPLYYEAWKKLIDGHKITPIQGVFGRSTLKIKNGTTICIQGGDTPAWDKLLFSIVYKFSDDKKDILKNSNITFRIYIPDRIANAPGFKPLFSGHCPWIKPLSLMEGTTLTPLLSESDFLVTRAGGGTVNDAIACRVPFISVEEPLQKQVNETMKMCIKNGITRKISYNKFIENPLDIILEEFNRKEENNRIKSSMDKIPDNLEALITEEIIKKVEG